MSPEKLQKVLETYCERLNEYPPVNREDIRLEQSNHFGNCEILCYIHWMCDACRKILDNALIPDGHSAPIIDLTEIEKAMRWLGFIQGVLWICGIYTIDEMREHNRDSVV